MNTTQMPAELAEVVALHRELFGGFTMTAGATEGAGSGSQAGGTGGNAGAAGTNTQGGTNGAQGGAEDEWDPAGFDPQKPTTWHPSARAYVQNLREEARTLRTSQEQAVNAAREAARQELAQQLGFTKKDDSNEGTNPLAQDENNDLAIAQMEGLLQRAELVVWKNASTLGVDAGALADSRSFEAAILELDPDSDDFDGEVQEVVKKILKANPKLAAGQTPTRRAGVTFPGGTGDNGQQRKAVSLDEAVAGFYGNGAN